MKYRCKVCGRVTHHPKEKLKSWEEVFGMKGFKNQKAIVLYCPFCGSYEIEREDNK